MINISVLNNEEKNFLCSIINNLGSGEHPVAEEHTLSGFQKEYVNELFVLAESKLSPKGLEVLTQVKEKLCTD